MVAALGWDETGGMFMKRLLVLAVVAVLGGVGLTPAVSAGNYQVAQKSLSPFSAGITSLTDKQKSEIEATVLANPNAEKFICTGIRFESDPLSVNISVRSRARAACDYAKLLNPSLSTWYQNKPTKAKSFAGKVLLTVKSPQSSSGEIVTTRTDYRYPPCDTTKFQAPTRKYSRDATGLTYETDCATDRTTAVEALPATVSGTNLEPCMLQDQSVEARSVDGMRVGFPRSTTSWGPGTKKVLIIAFDWPDLKDPIDPVVELKGHADMYRDYMKTFSRGNVDIDYEIYPKRIMMLEPSSKFSQSEAQQNTSQWGDANVSAVDYFYSEFIKAADDQIDFNYDLYLIIPPRHQNIFAEFNLWPPHSATYQTSEQPITRAFTPGGDYHFRPENDLWFFWSHESMHYFRLPDLYWADQNSVKRTENTFSGAFKNYDIMDGASVRTLNSYLMWLGNWTKPGEQECLTSSNFKDSSYELFPVSNSDSTLKSVMIKLSDSQLLVVESRRYSKFDRIGLRAKEGALVYLVDTRIGHGEGALTVLAPSGRTIIYDNLFAGAGTSMLDAFLYEGNKIEIAGYRIQVNKAYAGSDVVSISKISDWKSGSADYVCVTKDNRQLDDPSRLSCPISF